MLKDVTISGNFTFYMDVVLLTFVGILPTAILPLAKLLLDQKNAQDAIIPGYLENKNK